MDKINVLMLKIVISIIIIIIILLIAINSIIKKEDKKFSKVPDDVVMDIENYEATYKISEVHNVASVMTINNCIDTYLNYISEKNNEAIYNILIDDYIKQNNITENNVMDKGEKIRAHSFYMTKRAFEYDHGFYLKTYFVIGNIINENDKSKELYNYILTVDNKNRTFSIAPLDKVYTDYIDYYSEDRIEIKTGFNEIVEEIEVNDYNYADITVGIRR